MLSQSFLVAAGSVLILAGAACNETVEDETMAEPGVGVEEPAVGTMGDADVATEAAPDIEDVVENPAAYANRTVTLSGEVEETFVPGRAFSMTGGGLIAENQIMVLVRDEHAVEEGQTVRVTGQVRPYMAADLKQFETDLGWDFDADLESELEGTEAVLIAETISATATAQ